MRISLFGFSFFCISVSYIEPISRWNTLCVQEVEIIPLKSFIHMEWCNRWRRVPRFMYMRWYSDNCAKIYSRTPTDRLNAKRENNEYYSLLIFDIDISTTELIHSQLHSWLYLFSFLFLLSGIVFFFCLLHIEVTCKGKLIHGIP